VQTDHVLFIASGAFHIAKPSDLVPELQGRLPIRVELRALTEADFVRILTETDNALTRQYSALMATENVGVDFTPDGIAALARITVPAESAVTTSAFVMTRSVGIGVSRVPPDALARAVICVNAGSCGRERGG